MLLSKVHENTRMHTATSLHTARRTRCLTSPRWRAGHQPSHLERGLDRDTALESTILLSSLSHKARVQLGVQLRAAAVQDLVSGEHPARVSHNGAAAHALPAALHAQHAQAPRHAVSVPRFACVSRKGAATRVQPTAFRNTIAPGRGILPCLQDLRQVHQHKPAYIIHKIDRHVRSTS